MTFSLGNSRYYYGSRWCGHTNDLEDKSTAKIRDHNIVTIDNGYTLKSISKIAFIDGREGGTAAKFGIGSTIVPILNITRQRS